MQEKLERIGRAFGLSGRVEEFGEIKEGLINCTLRVRFSGERDSYIFQRINTAVFAEPRMVMENIAKVLAHIRAKEPGARVLEFLTAADGENYLELDGEFWRVSRYVDSVNRDRLDCPGFLFSVGSAFGRFGRQLSDLPAGTLAETIPGFHDTRKRLAKLFEDVEKDPLGRAKECGPEIAYLRGRAERACLACDAFARGELPVRVTHNDTRGNNVLFDRDTMEPLMVIDLDTVMPGNIPYEIADGAKAACITAPFDEADLSKVHFDLGCFREFCGGYLSEMGACLTERETGLIAPAVFAIAIEQTARFLDDYLTGDLYYQTDYPGENLRRTRAHVAFAEDILAKYTEIERIVAELAGKEKH